MDREASAASELVLNFIRDEASSEDFFGSHDRLAGAIASVIHTNPDLKVIGLLGSWGSGKSTVVKLLQSKLEKDEAIKTFCFCYDAWLHQNDPPRRSFLETLIHYLIVSKLTAADKWQNRLDQLNRQIEDTETTTTPTLTTSGHLIILSLFILPLGMQFVGYEWANAAFGKEHTAGALWAFVFGVTCLLLPALLASSVYLFWRPTWWPFKREFWRLHNWRSHKTPHEQDSILSLFTNKERQRQRNRVTRAPDPTTIEFQDIFREIMEAVSKPERRFLFVIDNLDRLPEADAVAMWGTIRSFFLGAQETNQVRKTTKLPTVILPIDQDAVRRMYAVSHGDGADDLARSFMDKTFDLTFRVTRPVLSDWNAYLARQMQTVFGSHLGKDWPYLVGRMYEKFLTTQQDLIITPRTINTLINSIATLWLQWRSADITFTSIAYYAIYRDAIDGNVAIPYAGIDDLDPDWQQSVAAIHYGVMPKDALQILIEQPLRKATTERNLEEFRKLASTRGFDCVLQRVFDQQAAANPSDPIFIFNAAFLLDALNPPSDVWVSSAWQALHSGFRKTGDWKSFGPDQVASLRAFLAHSTAATLGSLIAKVEDKSSRFDEATLANPEFPKAFVSAWQATSEAGKSMDVPLPKIVVPGDAALFLTVVDAASGNAELMARLTTKAADGEVLQILATDMADPPRAPTVEPRLRALIARGIGLAWKPLVTAAGQLIETQDSKHTGMPAALACLGLLRSVDTAAEAEAKRLGDGGQLAAKLNQAHSANQDLIEARLVALLLLTNVNFEVPEDGLWQQRFDSRPQLAALIDTALIEFNAPLDLKFFVACVISNAKLLQISRAVLSLRVREARLGSLSVEQVIGELPQYLACVDEPLRDSFIRQVSQNDDFWAEFKKQPPGGNTTTILYALIKSGSGAESEAQADLRERLDAVTSETWEAAIKTGGEPLPLLIALSENTSAKPQIGYQLVDALQKIMPSLLSSADQGVRSRWFGATAFLSPSARPTLFRNLRDQINASPSIPELRSLLVTGTDALLSEGDFADKPDDAVRHVILPLIAGREDLAWLAGQPKAFETWVAKSADTTRVFLTEQLSDLWNAGNDEDKGWLTALQQAWSLQELPLPAPKEDPTSEAGDVEAADTDSQRV